MSRLQLYQDFNRKKDEFAFYKKIDDKTDLFNTIKSLENRNFIFRGLNNASFKLYSSAQRHWLLKDSYYRNIGGKDFTEFIENAIKKARSDKGLANFYNSRGISLNDFLILSVIQHYINISPLLDFTLDINSALFFAIDGSSLPVGNGGPEDYISLYFIDNTIDWMRASIQSINISGVRQIDSLLSNFSENDRKRISCDEVLEETRNLTYGKYSNIGFIVVDGPDNGIPIEDLPNWDSNAHIILRILGFSSKKGNLFLIRMKTYLWLKELMHLLDIKELYVV